MTNHPLGQSLLIGFGGVDGGDVFTLAQNGNTVRNIHNLVELMGDNNDGVALFLHTAQDGKQLFDFLNGKNSSRFVQNNDLGAIIQHLDDLQRLLLGNRHIVDLLLGINVETEFLRHVLDFCIAILLQHQAGIVLAHPDIVSGGKHIHKLEVLMHHADAQPLGILGRINGNLLSINKDLAAIRLINTGNHIHQSGLAGTVFTQKCQNLTGLHIQFHIFICHHTAEGFGNAFQLDGILLCHGGFLLYISYSFWPKPGKKKQRVFSLPRV